MNLYFIQHVPFETPAAILDWCKLRNIQTNGFYAYKENLENMDLNRCNILLIMGGPMGVYDLTLEEKKLVEQAIKLNKKVVGICLGAQLIADVLGAKVYKNKQKEIGWYAVNSTKEAREQFDFLPESFYAFHWHGDTFELPKNSIHLFYNEATYHQGFLYYNALALQFHLESTEESIQDLYKNSYDDIRNATDKKFIKEYNQQENNQLIQQSNELLFKILDDFILKK
jgi:GMP synthase (glutamine-hydrolysing)